MCVTVVPLQSAICHRFCCQAAPDESAMCQPYFLCEDRTPRYQPILMLRTAPLDVMPCALPLRMYVSDHVDADIPSM
jgi:hypothetical protein